MTNTCLRGVLVAISIPIFTSQLEKSREATDAANIRSAYAEVQATALTEETNLKKGDTDLFTFSVTGSGAGSYIYSAEITLTQKQADWQGTTPDIAGLKTDSKPSVNGKAVVQYSESTGKTTLEFKEGVKVIH
ncbi:MAG: hypothetical protein MR580_01280 [Anaerolactibacter massiliensis]|nr:hypothetical protein [Anaerolactibacter massiliensis]